MATSNIAIDHAASGLVTAVVSRAERISESFVRVTVSGDALANWRHLGYDQWFRLALPVAGDTRFDKLADRFDMRGYLRYLTLPKATKPAIRNYTVREFRPELRELDIDFVVHGAEGIAGPWAASLPTGSPVALIDQGRGFHPGAGVKRVIIAADESALPAALGVLRDLPRGTVGNAVLEVPDPSDSQPVAAPAGVSVHWIVRAPTSRPGAEALSALKSLAVRSALPTLPPHPADAERGPGSATQAFVAGEQQLASGGRRFLVNELGLGKSQVKFCGYWRQH